MLITTAYISTMIIEYYLIPLYLLSFIFSIMQKPYKRNIHNIGIIMNNFTVLFYLIWCASRDNVSVLLLQED